MGDLNILIPPPVSSDHNEGERGANVTTVNEALLVTEQAGITVQSRLASTDITSTYLGYSGFFGGGKWRCVDHLYECQSEKPDTSPKPGHVSSCEDVPGGTLCLHWSGRVVRQLRPLAGPSRPGGGTAWDSSPSRTWTTRGLRGAPADRRAPAAAAAVRWGPAIAGLCFQSAGSSAGEDRTFFSSAVAEGRSRYKNINNREEHS